MSDWSPQYVEPIYVKPTYAKPPTPAYLVAPLAPAAYAAPRSKRRIDLYLRLIISVGFGVLVWLLLTNTTPSPWSASQSEFVEIPVVEPAGPAGAMPIEAAEAFAATYTAHLDSHGSYVESGQEVARAFGAELVWSDYDTPDPHSPCRHDPDATFEALAWYCSGEPYLLHLNRTAATMPQVLYFPDFMDTVRHELAHLVIHQRCGTSEPVEGTVELEAVTSSYAVLYLGADRDALGDATSAYAEYEMTTQTDETATWIHAGVCW